MLLLLPDVVVVRPLPLTDDLLVVLALLEAGVGSRVPLGDLGVNFLRLLFAGDEVVVGDVAAVEVELEPDAPNRRMRVFGAAVAGAVVDAVGDSVLPSPVFCNDP